MIKKFLLLKEFKYVMIFLDDNFKKNSVDDKFWIYCKGCDSYVFRKDIEENLFVCLKCLRYYGLRVRKRINLLIDKGIFMEFNFDVEF